jgi:hypothetical protein
MADPNNPGQFGNQEDTEPQAERGGDTQSEDNEESLDTSQENM